MSSATYPRSTIVRSVTMSGRDAPMVRRTDASRFRGTTADVHEAWQDGLGCRHRRAPSRISGIESPVD